MPQSYPVSAIATLLKLSERRVQQLVKDDILPRPIKGLYDAIGCVHGYVDYLKRLITGGGELSLTDERTRLTKLQGDLAELQLRKAHGELTDTKAESQWLSEVFTAIRQRLLGLSTRLSPMLVAIPSIPDIKAKIDNEIYEILNEIADPDLRAAAGRPQEGAQSIQASTPSHRKRVGRPKKKAKLRVKRRAGDVADISSRVSEGDDGRVQRPSRRDGHTNDLKSGGKD